MPQVESVKPKRHHTRVIALVAVAVVVAVLGAAGFLAWRMVPSAGDSVKKADALDDQGKYAEALDLLQTANGRALSKDDKALVVSRLAATYSDMGDNPNALKYYQQLDQLDPNNYATLMNIGELAQNMGNKPLAVSTYSKAIDLLKAGKPNIGTQAKIDTLTAAVAALKQ